MANIEPNVASNLVSGFRTCGIVPCHTAQVLRKLPTANSNTSVSATEGTPVKSGVSAAVLSMLQKMRYGDKDNAAVVRRPRKKVSVEPRKSVAASDINMNDKMPSTSCKNKVAVPARKKAKEGVKMLTLKKQAET